MLTDDERTQVTEALRDWSVTAPDVPMLGFLGGGKPGRDFLTPKEMVEAVENRTEDGEGLLEIIEHSLRREGMDSVLARIRKEAV